MCPQQARPLFILTRLEARVMFNLDYSTDTTKRKRGHMKGAAVIAFSLTAGSIFGYIARGTIDRFNGIYIQVAPALRQSKLMYQHQDQIAAPLEPGANRLMLDLQNKAEEKEYPGDKGKVSKAVQADEAQRAKSVTDFLNSRRNSKSDPPSSIRLIQLQIAIADTWRPISFSPLCVARR